MATYYINPTFQFNGNGLSRAAATSDGAAGAFNAIPTISANNTYLVEAGTTVTISAQITTAANSIIGVVGSGKATLDASNSTQAVFRLAGSNTEIFGFRIITGSANGNCHGVYAASSGVFGVHIHHNDFVGPRSTSYALAGITTLGMDGGPTRIHHNTFSGYRYSIHHAPDSASGGGMIYKNVSIDNIGPNAGDEEKFLHCDNGLALDYGYSLQVFDNTIAGYGEYAIDLTGAAKVKVFRNVIGDPNGRWDYPGGINCGSATSGGTAKIFKNLIVSANLYSGVNARGSSNNLMYANIINCIVPLNVGTAGASNMRAENNTLIAASGGIAVDVVIGTGHVLRNNALIGCLRTAATTSVTYEANCHSVAPTGSGTVIDDNATSFVGDPQLTMSYLPENASLMRAGIAVPMGREDFYGNAVCTRTPSIGAVEIKPAIFL